MGIGTTLLTSLIISLSLTAMLWFGGAFRRMTRIQNERQRRFDGRPNIHGVEWGTGSRATSSFALAIWFVIFGISFFGLLILF